MAHGQQEVTSSTRTRGILCALSSSSYYGSSLQNCHAADTARRAESRRQSAPALPTVYRCGFLSSSYHCSSWQVVLLPARLVEQLCRPSAPALALVHRCGHRCSRGMSLLPPRRARLHTPVPPRAKHHSEMCIQWLSSRGKPLLSSFCAPEHTPAPPKATCHARQPVTAFSLSLVLSSLRCSLCCRQNSCYLTSSPCKGRPALPARRQAPIRRARPLHGVRQLSPDES